ncbi:antibiotic biosynthesis monooxygenase family protein [Paraburkholderia sp. B3]|uniref:antibiotic biosynthesis monooxygenase family protein n=1 Tax=Paraburkholderia sp. B3 TaxID=3134791 RepID=UPI003981D740
MQRSSESGEGLVVYEMAHIVVQQGKNAEFEAGVAQALALFHRARGCRGVELQRSIEEPNQYVLVVQWDTVEDHMVHFRESADFQVWRQLVGPYFEKPPVVGHTQVVVK